MVGGGCRQWPAANVKNPFEIDNNSTFLALTALFMLKQHTGTAGHMSIVDWFILLETGYNLRLGVKPVTCQYLNIDWIL